MVYFIEKISQCDPKILAYENWPAADPKGVNLLKNNPEKAGYIMRADVVHYLYNCMIEIFSVRSLVATRYKVEDRLHMALERVIKNSQPDTHHSEEGSAGVMISPLGTIRICVSDVFELHQSRSVSLTLLYIRLHRIYPEVLAGHWRICYWHTLRDVVLAGSVEPR